MKQKLMFLWTMAVLLMMACSDDDATLTLLPGSSDTVRFSSSNYQRAIVSFDSSDSWKVQVAEADGNECKWMSVSPMEGKSGKSSITLIVESANGTGKERTAIVSLSAGGSVLQRVTVTQDKMDIILPD